jgi:hypothetical protein
MVPGGGGHGIGRADHLAHAQTATGQQRPVDPRPVIAVWPETDRTRTGPSSRTTDATWPHWLHPVPVLAEEVEAAQLQALVKVPGLPWSLLLRASQPRRWFPLVCPVLWP